MVAASKVIAVLVTAGTWMLAGCLGADVPTASDGSRGLEEGDSWTMTMDYGESGDDEGDRYILTSTETVTGLTTRDGEAVYEIDVDVDLPPQEDLEGRTVHRTETMWVRMSDLSVMERKTHREGTISPELGGAGGGYSFSSDSTQTFEPGCGSLMVRGLHVGDEWTSTCRGSSVSVEWTSKRGSDWHNGTHEETTMYKVEALETVTVPAGTFMAYRITSTGESSGDTHSAGTTWVAPDACGRSPVKSVDEYETDEHSGTTTTELVELDC